MFCPVFYTLFGLIAVSKFALATVQSCHACAGPQKDCVANNRTDFLKMDCNSFTVEGVSLIQRTDQSNLLEKFDSEVGARREDSEIGCLTLTFNHAAESPENRALKSCVPAEVLDQDICSYMEGLVDYLGGDKISCHFCKTDDCNSAISFPIGRSAMFVVYLITFCRSYFL